MTEKLKALKEDGWSEFAMNTEPKCPHCAEYFSIASNEAWYLYSEDGPHEVECKSCHQEFKINSLANWTFSTDEQDDYDD